MDFEKIVKTQEKEKSVLKNRDMAIINKLIAQAIKDEDYDRAATLRDLNNSDIKFEVSKKDIFAIRPGLTKMEPEDDPRLEIWEDIEEERAKGFWEGRETVKDSDLYDILKRDRILMTKYGQDLMMEVDELDKKNGGERGDFLIILYEQRAEAKRMADISQEKMDAIWLPYCQRAGLSEAEGGRYLKHFIEFGLSSEQWKEIQIPRSIEKPLAFWQRINENAKIILDEVEDVINDLEAKS